PATLSAFADPYYEEAVWQTFKTSLGFARAYPPLATWETIENAIVGEFRNVLAAYVDGTLERQGGVQAFLNRAAEQVDRALRDERRRARRAAGLRPGRPSIRCRATFNPGRRL